MKPPTAALRAAYTYIHGPRTAIWNVSYSGDHRQGRRDGIGLHAVHPACLRTCTGIRCPCDTWEWRSRSWMTANIYLLTYCPVAKSAIYRQLLRAGRLMDRSSRRTAQAVRTVGWSAWVGAGPVGGGRSGRGGRTDGRTDRPCLLVGGSVQRTARTTRCGAQDVNAEPTQRARQQNKNKKIKKEKEINLNVTGAEFKHAVQSGV